jgi:hypothetical protein
MTTQWLSVGLLAALIGASACASRPDDFGRAQAEARARQTENPGAGETPVPVENMEAGTSKDVLENYHRNQNTEVQEQRQRRQRRDGISNVGGR